jgi:hypothetical protein
VYVQSGFWLPAAVRCLSILFGLLICQSLIGCVGSARGYAAETMSDLKVGSSAPAFASPSRATMAPGPGVPDRMEGALAFNDAPLDAEPRSKSDAGGPSPVESVEEPSGTETKPSSRAPLLIYKAQLRLAVFETTATLDAILAMTKAAGGYLVRRSNHGIKVRIPTEKFREVLDAIGKRGDVLHRQEDVLDVTDKYFDLYVRLKNARAMRERLVQLLDRAENVKGALAVERELGRVTATIEKLSGKLKLMRELLAFSTISVELKPRRSESIDSTVELPFPWLYQLGLSGLLNL